MAMDINLSGSASSAGVASALGGVAQSFLEEKKTKERFQFERDILQQNAKELTELDNQLILGREKARMAVDQEYTLQRMTRTKELELQLDEERKRNDFNMEEQRRLKDMEIGKAQLDHLDKYIRDNNITEKSQIWNSIQERRAYWTDQAKGGVAAPERMYNLPEQTTLTPEERAKAERISVGLLPKERTPVASLEQKREALVSMYGEEAKTGSIQDWEEETRNAGLDPEALYQGVIAPAKVETVTDMSQLPENAEVAINEKGEKIVSTDGQKTWRVLETGVANPSTLTTEAPIQPKKSVQDYKDMIQSVMKDNPPKSFGTVDMAKQGAVLNEVQKTPEGKQAYAEWQAEHNPPKSDRFIEMMQRWNKETR